MKTCELCGEQFTPIYGPDVAEMCSECKADTYWQDFAYCDDLNRQHRLKKEVKHVQNLPVQ